MGCCKRVFGMFIRKNKNRSGSYSIPIISKKGERYKVIITTGSARSDREIEYFLYSTLDTRIAITI